MSVVKLNFLSPTIRHLNVRYQVDGEPGYYCSDTRTLEWKGHHLSAFIYPSAPMAW